MEILTFILILILIIIITAILIWGGVTNWQFAHKMYSCQKISDIFNIFLCSRFERNKKQSQNAINHVRHLK